MSSPSASVRKARFGSYEADFRAGELLKNGRRIRLQDQPLQILAMLLEQPGGVVTREELRQRLWPTDTFVDFDHGLNNAINKLRDALNDSADSPRFIETLPRRGYRFIGELEAPATPEAVLAVSPKPDEGVAQNVVHLKRPRTVRRWILVFAALAALLVVGALLRYSSSASSRNIQSIAVLPLDNLSRDPEQEYFADGMTEALIANLAQLKALRVISRTSVMHYKGPKPALPQIARDLNVDAVIEGTVQRSGNRVRVTAQLIDGQTDVHLWAKTYERDSQDVLMMQSDLAQAIAREINVQLTPLERQRLARARPISAEAYDAYLLGNYHASKRNPAAIEKAIKYFEQAIRIDPGYAQPYAGLASAYLERDIWGGLGLGKSADEVRANTFKALELDGDLAEGHALLGDIYFEYECDWVHTEAEFKRAIELNANLPRSYERYAFFLQAMGRHQEALAAAHRAVELDPLSAWYISEEGRILYRERDYRKSIAQYERALELDPGYLPALSRISEAYEQLGNYDEALARAQKFQQVSGNAWVALGLKARIYGRTGKRSQAEEILRTLKKDRLQSGDEYFYASIYASMGDLDRAFAELDKMVKRRSRMAFVLMDPQLDALRSDPRFQQILRRANLPS